MLIEKSQKLAKKFICSSCDYSSSKESDYKKHLLTGKHNKLINVNPLLIQKISAFICTVCSKEYKSNVGLWKHKKKCITIQDNTETKINDNCNNTVLSTPDVAFFTNLVLEVVKNNSELQKQNHDFQKQMMEMYKTTNTSITNNSHNKTFNMQFFLNEQCKDAMNIMDFVNSMTLDFSDLEDVGKLGYVEGISGIIIKKLNEMDVYKRPIHCSDGKREIMFVKDDNVWEKENSTYDRIRKAIKHITKKNGDMMIPWSKKYPACMNIEHHLNDVYVQIMSQCMGGKESFVESENKIMKKIAKAVLIDKI
jgi:hypothetical protein